MKNCIVKTLNGKAVIESPEYFAELVLPLKARSGARLFSPSALYNTHTGPTDAKAGKVWLTGDDVKMYSDQAMQHEVEYMTTKSHESGGQQVCTGFVVVAPNGGELHIKNKYNLENFLVNPSEVGPFPLKDLAYIGDDCITFLLESGVVTGVLNDIAPRLNVESLKFNNSGSVTTLTGDIVDFAEKQVELGRTSGTCVIKACNTLTYNGSACTSGQTFTITYSSSLPNGYSITT